MGKQLKKEIIPDPIFNDILVSKFINQIMRKGKKSIARRIVYNSFKKIKEKKKKDPIEIFNTALENASPSMEVRSKRIGGAIYQVPIAVSRERRTSLAMRWLVTAAKSKKGRPMEDKLTDEIISASENTGAAVKKKEDVHKMAEANKAFAHFAM
jgi:small subunit ribosomal protein S7